MDMDDGEAEEGELEEGEAAEEPKDVAMPDADPEGMLQDPRPHHLRYEPCDARLASPGCNSLQRQEGFILSAPSPVCRVRNGVGASHMRISQRALALIVQEKQLQQL